MAGRWFQLAGVVKLLEYKGSVGGCRVHWTSEFISCSFSFRVSVEGGVLVRQDAKLNNHKGGGRTVVVVKLKGSPSGKLGGRAAVAFSGV
jgi:hypothetical protein